MEYSKGILKVPIPKPTKSYDTICWGVQGSWNQQQINAP